MIGALHEEMKRLVGAVGTKLTSLVIACEQCKHGVAKLELNGTGCLPLGSRSSEYLALEAPHSHSPRSNGSPTIATSGMAQQRLCFCFAMMGLGFKQRVCFCFAMIAASGMAQQRLCSRPRVFFCPLSPLDRQGYLRVDRAGTD
ncbi:hypothetical protein L7F22_061472 [Adiantum nelumboides]|nr:hypothetical protein [Adiantum nelumboides]